MATKRLKQPQRSLKEAFLIQQSFLWQNRDKAILRAKTLQLFAHPSSSIYLLLDRLEKTIQKQ